MTCKPDDPEGLSWRALVEACRAYYNDENAPNAAGGCLHIALDDGNLGDKDLDFCIEYAREHGDSAGVELATKVRGLSLAQREKLYDHYNDYAYGASFE